MRISFLLLTVDHLAGTERAVINQANALSSRHEVEIISILRVSAVDRSDIDPAVTLTYLAMAIPQQPVTTLARGLVPPETAEKLIHGHSVLIPHSWDPTLNALCDVVLEDYLPRLKADVVVTLTPGLLAAATQLLPPEVAVVHQEHRSSMHRTSGREALLTFAPRADVVASLAEVNTQWLKDQLESHSPRLVTVPNAAPSGYRPRSLLDQPLIVAAGRLVTEKNHIDTVRAFGEISEQIPEWRLRIFGVGNQRKRLLSTTRKLGLYDRVELPGVTIDMASEWARASMAVLSSRKEGFPLVIQEAMAAGVPVVAYDCPTGPSEIIRHGHNGLLVVLDDRRALAKAMLDLATDERLRHRIGEAGHATGQEYSASVIATIWESIYSEAVAAHRRGVGGRAARRARAATAHERGLHPDATAPVAAAETTTPREARRLALQVVQAAASRAGCWWFVLPRYGDVLTAVVPMSRRESMLKALAACDVPDILSLAVDDHDYWMAMRGTIEEMAAKLGQRMTPAVMLEAWPGRADRPNHLNRAAGIRIEFWSESSDGTLVAPRVNPYCSAVHKGIRLGSAEIDGEQVPILEGLSATEHVGFQCPFPIDVVYTWVDDTDASWRRARDARIRSWTGEGTREAEGEARFRNRDELRYSLRSLHMFAPWVRTIHLVTAGQRPSWLLNHPGVRLVDHADILPPQALPTFNSHAIEAGLVNVPDLSEHFLYFNDDVFLGRPMWPEQFFTSGGLFAVFATEQPIANYGVDDRPFMAAARNNRRLLQERFGSTITEMLAHTPHPHRRGVLRRVVDEFSSEVRRTVTTPFRSSTDVSVMSSLAQHYGILSGYAYYGSIEDLFLNLSSPGVERRLHRARLRNYDSLCLADHHDYSLPYHRITKTLETFLEEYFPIPAPWERPE